MEGSAVGGAAVGTSGGNGGAGGGTGGVADGTDDSAGGTGGAGPGTSDGSGGTGDSQQRTGSIQLGTLYYYPTTGQVTSFARASFSLGNEGQVDAGGGCSSEAFGDCVITSCSDVDPGAPSPSPAPTQQPHAGTITIATDGDSFGAVLAPGADGRYADVVPTGHLAGGERVTVSAAGGDVPRFTHALDYPLALLLSEPALPEESVIRPPRDADLVLRWSRGVSGVSFVVQSLGGTFMLCSVPSETGTLTIPSAALAAVEAQQSLALLAAGTDSVTAGEFVISVTHASAVLTSDRTRSVQILVE
jgi:hypothetical protein